MSLVLAAAILVTAPPPVPVAQVEAGFEDLAEGQTAEAIARIQANGDTASHPASLINLAAAYVRQGDTLRAKQALERAAAGERYHLETADGQWVDSRALALRAMAGLQARQQTRTAMR